jgi:DNA-binding GntR family transcriptional regulator
MATKKPATSAKYLPVYEKLRAQIDNGMLATGAILPTEDQLCKEFDVSRYAL